MTESTGDERFPGDLDRLAELDVVRSALVLETSGRVRERAGAGHRSSLRRAAVLSAAVHSAAVHLGAATGTGAVRKVAIQGATQSVLLVPVPTRGIPLLLVLVCEGEEGDELHRRLSTFLERMGASTPTEDRVQAEELEESLLKGLERLFPPDDELAV